MEHSMDEWAASIDACARSTSYEHYLELMQEAAEKLEAEHG